MFQSPLRREKGDLEDKVKKCSCTQTDKGFEVCLIEAIKPLHEFKHDEHLIKKFVQDFRKNAEYFIEDTIKRPYP